MKYTIALLPSPLTGPEPTLSLVGSVAGYSWTEFGNIAAATGANAVNTRIGQEIYLQGHYSKTTYFNNSPVPIYVRHLIVSLPSQMLRVVLMLLSYLPIQVKVFHLQPLEIQQLLCRYQ